MLLSLSVPHLYSGDISPALPHRGVVRIELWRCSDTRVMGTFLVPGELAAGVMLKKQAIPGTRSSLVL